MNAMPEIVNRHPQAYHIGAAKYAKGKYVVQTYDASYGFKGPASRAADTVNAKWVNRSNGYSMSPAQVRRFQDAYEAELKERQFQDDYKAAIEEGRERYPAPTAPQVAS